MRFKIIIVIFILNFWEILLAQTIPFNRDFQINTYTSGKQDKPKICSLSGGGFVVCWESNGQDGSLLGIFGQIFDSRGIKYGEEFMANTHTSGSQYYHDVSSLTDGGFVVCWTSEDLDGSGSEIFGKIYNRNGTNRTEEFQINTYTGDYQSSPTVFGMSNGDIVVCWQSRGQDGSMNGIFGKILDSSGNEIYQEFQVNDYTPYDQQRASICALSNNRFLVCWESYGQDGSDNGVFGKILDSSGNEIYQEFQINDYTLYDQQRASICALSNNRFLVCWESWNQDGDLWGVFGQMYDTSATRIGKEFQINTYTSSFQYKPAICRLSDDRFMVCWESYNQDGDSWGIFGQMYDTSATRIGEEFQVNTFSSDLQWKPSISALSDNKFIIGWGGIGQNSDNTEIYGKVYDHSDELSDFFLLNPLNDATLKKTSVTFHWSSSCGFNVNLPWSPQYQLFLNYDYEFIDPMIISSIHDTVYTVNSLIPGQTYFWKVLAKNIEGDSLWSSETFGFYISPAAAIEDKSILRPETFTLYPNYPNPFNPVTMINYQLPISCDVEISIYDLLGRKVVKLISDRQNAGLHQVGWDATGFNSGVYFLTLEAGNFRATQKMLLLK